MPKYRIFAGLDGGFNSVCQQAVEQHRNIELAEESAYAFACEEYESYHGLHGLMSWQKAEDEAASYLDEADYEDDEDAYNSELESRATQIYNDSREDWIIYYAEEVTDEELAILPVKEVED